MDEFLKMDIFFVVATVAVVVLTILWIIILIRVLRILRKVEEISLMVSEEGKELRADIAHARAELVQKGLILGAIGAASRLFKRRSPKNKKTSE